jgi:AcrR family transcriptional regulator
VKRRRLDPGDRKREILLVATQAFATLPYDSVHVDAIASEANASRALINHYFRDKRGLFVAVIRQIVEQTPTVVRTDLELEPEEMVAANTAAWLDAVEAGRETFFMFAGGGPLGHDPMVDEAQDELRDRVAERMLANHLGTTDFPPAALATMRAELGLIERAIKDWLGGRISREQTHTLIVRSILATVREVLPVMVRQEAEGG